MFQLRSSCGSRKIRKNNQGANQNVGVAAVLGACGLCGVHRHSDLPLFLQAVRRLLHAGDQRARIRQRDVLGRVDRRHHRLLRLPLARLSALHRAAAQRRRHGAGVAARLGVHRHAVLRRRRRAVAAHFLRLFAAGRIHARRRVWLAARRGGRAGDADRDLLPDLLGAQGRPAGAGASGSADTGSYKSQ